MEMLAPVGNLENLRIAIAHGADAVYLSAGKFNARAKCQEINLDNLKECVSFAHLFNVKVYLTVNTIVKNEELSDVLETLKVAVDAKVDAFIVQDLSVYKLLKTCFEGACIHASTQMGIHNLAGAKFLESLGFKRVVLSRETTLEDIKQIHENTNLEIECFVQGALCVAFSGNCYYSSLINNASGNRGECLQLCRLKYSAYENQKNVKDGYLLSAGDLCLINHLSKLKEAGVCSLKIEGRLKRGAYVAQCIRSYKNALKHCDINDEIYKLKKVFSRGEYVENYILGDKNIIRPNFQNHMGVEIGKVKKVEKFKDIFKITIKTNGYKINSGDGLKFLKGVSQQSVGVGNVDYNNGCYIIYSKTRVEENSIVHLTLDKQMEQNLTLFSRKLKVDIKAKVEQGKPLYAQLISGETKVEVFGEMVDSAKSSPLTEKDILDNFNKTTDTVFEVKNMEVCLDDAFVPKSKLNAFRRECFEKLKNKIIENYNKKIKTKFIKNYNFNFEENNNKNANYYIFNNLEQIKNINPKNNIFVYSPAFYNKKEIDEFIEKIPQDYLIYLNLPLIANYKDIKILDDILENKKIVGVLINNYYGLKYYGTKKIVLNYTLNIANNLSWDTLKTFADDFVKSCEKPLTTSLVGGVDFCGKIALMTFAHCPQKTCFNKKCTEHCEFKNLEYKLGEKTFKIRRTKVSTCYFELLSNYVDTKSPRFCKDLRE